MYVLVGDWKLRASRKHHWTAIDPRKIHHHLRKLFHSCMRCHNRWIKEKHCTKWTVTSHPSIVFPPFPVMHDSPKISKDSLRPQLQTANQPFPASLPLQRPTPTSLHWIVVISSRLRSFKSLGSIRLLHLVSWWVMAIMASFWCQVFFKKIESQSQDMWNNM